MAASPWPMPGVSTITRSEPAALQAATMSSSGLGQLGRAAGGQRAEQDLRRVDGVHADAVAEQRAAAAAAGGVDGEHRDAELVLLVEAEAADQLVGERRLARAAGAGDAEHGHRAARRPPPGARRADAAVEPTELEGGDGAGQRAAGRRRAARRGRRRGSATGSTSHVGDDRVDHRGQAEALAVLGGEDPGDAVGLELGDLARDDHAAAAAVDLARGRGPCSRRRSTR